MAIFQANLQSDHSNFGSVGTKLYGRPTKLTDQICSLTLHSALTTLECLRAGYSSKISPTGGSEAFIDVKALQDLCDGDHLTVVRNPKVSLQQPDQVSRNNCL